ncbi:AAA family ATPase [Sinomicrobium soli]|uniref:AAA family ATPase n=1 Tax=Sinomicrobium sp. N-1-3-6 TaxID=2219864 RepID=UPI000DCD8D0E|nr:ATP-binding protein [Sinomicrobium sp. N-1-3-6]RAV28601.1 ATPase [Sinomicrobium sp. N-1-3-6]
MAQTHKIVLTGGPGTGKTTVMHELEHRGYNCFSEISRQVILEARTLGIDQLFLNDPLLFSQKLIQSRQRQYNEAGKQAAEKVFLDRGVHDVIAYMHYAEADYPPSFAETCRQCRYDTVFLFPPWEAIYVSDNERYEDFGQARAIHNFIKSAYIAYGHHPVEVPTGTVKDRADFILHTCGNHSPGMM